MRTSTRLVRMLICLGATALLTACGSTVQTSSTARSSRLGGSTGLSAPDQTGTTGAAAAATTGGGGVAPVTSVPTVAPTTPGTTGSTGLPPVHVAPGAPVKVGVVLTNIASAADYGFSTGETLSEQDIDQALFNALNAHGGLVGHRISAVYAKTDPNSTSWSTDFRAACSLFTEDNHVQAVLGYQFNYDQGFEACLTKHGVPHLTTGFNIPDAVELRQHPLHRALAVPTIDSRSLAKLEGAIEDGVLTTRSRLGVAIDSCPGTERSWKTVAEPFLKVHHIDVAFFTQSGCSNGSADGAQGANQVPGALLKARQAGVDTLTFLTVSEGPVLAVIAPAAEAQGWYPTYLVSSLANLSTLEAQGSSTVPPDQLANVRGYGWMPSQDVGEDQQPPQTPGQKRCLALLRSQDVVPAQYGDRNNAFRICDAVFAYELALQHDGGDLLGTSVIRALDGLAPGAFSNPDVLDGATEFGPGRENVAPAHVRSVVWDAKGQRFVYRGRVRRMP